MQFMKIRNRKPLPKQIRFIIIVLATVVALNLLYWGYAFLSSPAVIRNPKFEHYHFRMQVVVDGEKEDFSKKKYQVATPKDACNTDLAATPIHFHDNKDQMVHIHWDGMTGGMVLKYYGWDHAGGASNSLGYRFDEFPSIKKVETKGELLPEVPKDAKFYVYIGDEKGYKEKSFTQFKHQNLEDFLEKKSNIPEAEETSLLDKLFPKAYAHNGVDHTTGAQHDEAKDLQKMNNLIGNVVVFVQKDKPSAKEVEARFADLEPLSNSTCAG
jgi:hypothetical protein